MSGFVNTGDFHIVYQSYKVREKETKIMQSGYRRKVLK
jgi:hypothetical protein